MLSTGGFTQQRGVFNLYSSIVYFTICMIQNPRYDGSDEQMDAGVDGAKAIGSNTDAAGRARKGSDGKCSLHK